MILDDKLKFSDSQAITAAAGSDNTVDLSDAGRDIGNGEKLHIVVVVKEDFADSGSNSTLSVALEGDSTESITPDGTETLFTIPALAEAGDRFIHTLNPGNAALEYRYARLKYTPNNGDLSAGKVSAYVTRDIEKWKAHAKGYTIS